uniref:Uncharacterized protein n=1 Tax=Anguilla anguilla TaxID=7936 RepID=A0A0E9XJX7_ANGAN
MEAHGHCNIAIIPTSFCEQDIPNHKNNVALLKKQGLLHGAAPSLPLFPSVAASDHSWLPQNRCMMDR